MLFKDRVCCVCDEHKKFLARPNAGQKLYCIECKEKITKEYGTDYWKPCSFEEFLNSILDSRKKRTTIKEHFQQIVEENEERQRRRFQNE